MMKRLKEMKRKYPKIVDVRGIGLMIGVELEKEKYKKMVPDKAFREGLLLLGCGEKTIRIAPPLIITKEEADQGLDIFEKVIKKVS